MHVLRTLFGLNHSAVSSTSLSSRMKCKFNWRLIALEVPYSVFPNSTGSASLADYKQVFNHPAGAGFRTCERLQLRPSKVMPSRALLSDTLRKSARHSDLRQMHLNAYCK